MSEEKISIGFVGGEGYTVIAWGKGFETDEKFVGEAKKYLVSSDSKVLHFDKDDFPILIVGVDDNEWETSKNYHALSGTASSEPPKTFDGFDVVESWYFRTSEELLNSKDFYRIHSETEKREYLKNILNKHTSQKNEEIKRLREENERLCEEIKRLQEENETPKKRQKN